MPHSEYTYSWIPGGPLFAQQPGLIDEMAALYAEHYGVWSRAEPSRAGEPIKLSPAKIKEWISSDDSIVLHFLRS